MNETGEVGLQKFQTVVIVFDNGDPGYFFGKAVVFPGDTKKVKGVKFTEPKLFEPGCEVVIGGPS